MTRDEYNRQRRIKATQRAAQFAQERHIRIQNARVEREEQEVFDHLHADIDAFMADHAARECS